MHKAVHNATVPIESRNATITATPLSVSFEDMVLAVTNPNFSNINDQKTLANQVGSLLLRAATGLVAYFDGSDYCYYSPDKEHWEWKLCSSKGWPVFVKDAEDWKDLQEGSCALPDKSDKSIYNIVENTYGSGDYNNYLLTVKFKDSECEGLSGYGNKTNQVLRSLNPTTIIPAYGLTCTTFTTVCDYFSQPGFGIGTAILDAAGCFISPAIGIFNAQRTQNIRTSIGEGFLIGTAIGASLQIATTTKAVLLKWKNMEKVTAAIRNAQSAKEIADDISHIKSLYDAVAKYAPDQIKGWDKLVGDTITDEYQRKLVEKLLKGEEIYADNLREAREAAAKLAGAAGEEVKKIQLRGFAKGIGCSVGGQVLGTVAAYGVVASQIISPETINVDIAGIDNIADITVSANKITVGGR